MDLDSRQTRKLTGDPHLKDYTWTGFGADVLWQRRVGDLTEFWIGDAASAHLEYVLV